MRLAADNASEVTTKTIIPSAHKRRKSRYITTGDLTAREFGWPNRRRTMEDVVRSRLELEPVPGRLLLIAKVALSRHDVRMHLLRRRRDRALAASAYDAEEVSFEFASHDGAVN